MKLHKRFLVLFLSFVLVTAASCENGEKGGETDTNGSGTSDSGALSDTITTDGGEEPMDDFKGIFLNVDLNTVTFPFLNQVIADETVTEEELYSFVDQYADTQITDVAFNIFCQISTSPTEVMTHLADRCEVTEVNGTAVDFFKATEGTYSLRGIYEIYKTYGIDPYEVWINRTREKGMTPWLSIRMNDCHDPDKLTSWLHGDLFYEAIENGWTVGGGYYRYCLDYSVPEVRERMLAYIKEQLLQYDVGGLELDFSREWHCFKSDGKDHAAIMNEFMRDVNAIVKEAETKWGHDIKINICLMRDIEQNKAFGFDAETMVKEKLVDIISVCPRWASNDSDMPIDEWKEKFPEVEIYARITDLTYNKGTTFQLVTGYSAQYLQQGADKIYLFNFFNSPMTGTEAYPLSSNEGYAKMYNYCGALSTLAEVGQRYVVTYQDIVPSGYTAWDPLPAKADGYELDIATGPVAEDDVVWVIIGVDQKLKREDVTVTVNGQKVTFKSMTQFSAPYSSNSAYQYRYSVPAEYCNADGEQTIAISTENDSLLIQYMEMTIGVRMG